MNNKLVVGGVVLAIVISGLAYFSAPEIVIEKVIERVGAQSGPDHYEHQNFKNGFTAGFRVATTTSTGSITTSAKDFQQMQTYWDVLPNVDLTFTITATSTHKYVPNVGDVATIYLRNASSTAAASITLAAANANLDLQYVEATGGDLQLDGLDFAKLTIIRESAYLTTVLFSEFTEAD